MAGTVDQPQIRRIRPGEWKAHRDTRLRMLTEAASAFGSTAQAAALLDDEDWKSWTEQRSSGSDEAMFVAEYEGGWVGTITASKVDDDPTKARVWGMWVADEWRRRGVARALLKQVTRWAKESSFQGLVLLVAETNHEARELYRSFGFVESGERRAMKRDPNLWMATMEMAL